MTEVQDSRRGRRTKRHMRVIERDGSHHVSASGDQRAIIKGLAACLLRALRPDYQNGATIVALFPGTASTEAVA